MRENIIKLIASGETAHTVALKTGLPRNTVYRLFNGESSLDNITLKNAEILNAYYEELVSKNPPMDEYLAENNMTMEDYLMQADFSDTPNGYKGARRYMKNLEDNTILELEAFLDLADTIGQHLKEKNTLSEDEYKARFKARKDAFMDKWQECNEEGDFI